MKKTDTICTSNAAYKTSEFEKSATRVTTITIIVNMLLSCFKLAAGILAHSGAMISDAIHSASDVFSSIIVIIGIKLSAKEADKEHPYGHERMECVAAIVLSVILLITGLFIGYSALNNIINSTNSTLTSPGILALIAAIISIVTKEAMFWYTKIYAKRLASSALMADAWHHRSDAFSSVGALIGIAGARIGFPVLDPAASIIICVFICKAAFDIFKDAINKMIDCSCDDSTKEAILCCVLSQEGVLSIDSLNTRVFGNKIYVDIEIGVDGDSTLDKAHAVAETVHNAIEDKFPMVKHIMVHINPYKE